MLAPAFTKKARKSARAHAQVSVVAISTPPAFTGGECRLTATVERVFRGSDCLLPASSVEFSVYCFIPPDRAPTGPEWLDFGRLKVGSLLEVFFDQHAADGSFEVAMWQITFIDSLTQEPQPNLWYQGESDHPCADPSFLRSLWRRLWRSG
jgi:hypothetical protein